MSDLKMLLDGEIRDALAEGDTEEIVARRLFSFNSSPVLENHRAIAFRIVNAVSQYFGVPFRAVFISGSAQTGYSYFKGRDFVPGDSDLDLAIVDSRLFQRYCEIVYAETRRYKDLTNFPVKEGVSRVEDFRQYLCIGYFRPDLMPYGRAKQEWFGFFNRLSKDYSDLFRNINCGIFLSQQFFEGKQVPLIRVYRRENK
jgi:hypothetical protein